MAAANAATAAAIMATDVSQARPRAGAGPDRLTVVLLTLAGFLAVLALLARQFPGAGAYHGSRPVPVLRKIYRTTVIETIEGSGGPSGTSVSQSVAGSGSSAAAIAPTTHTS